MNAYLICAFNNSVHDSTGFTPNYLICGRDIQLPFELCYPTTLPRSHAEEPDLTFQTSLLLADAWQIVFHNIQSAQQSYKYYHDRLISGHEFKVGDIVYISLPRVERGLVKGPYVITRIKGLNSYVRAVNTKGEPSGIEFLVHMQRLKKSTMPIEPFKPARYTSVKQATNTPIPDNRLDQTSTPSDNDFNNSRAGTSDATIDNPAQTTTTDHKSDTTPTHQYNLRSRTK